MPSLASISVVSFGFWVPGPPLGLSSTAIHPLQPGPVMDRDYLEDEKMSIFLSVCHQLGFCFKHNQLIKLTYMEDLFP